jgi:hypothetical protein
VVKRELVVYHPFLSNVTLGSHVVPTVLRAPPKPLFCLSGPAWDCPLSWQPRPSWSPGSKTTLLLGVAGATVPGQARPQLELQERRGEERRGGERGPWTAMPGSAPGPL